MNDYAKVALKEKWRRPQRVAAWITNDRCTSQRIPSVVTFSTGVAVIESTVPQSHVHFGQLCLLQLTRSTNCLAEVQNDLPSSGIFEQTSQQNASCAVKCEDLKHTM